MPTPRRHFLLTGAALAVAGCSPADGPPDPPQGGFVGPDPVRGHAMRDAGTAALADPASTHRVHTLIAGGGVAGLAAARALHLAGRDDFALLELEDEAGGNARATTLLGQPCPMGAHYLPVPGDHNPHLQALLAELGLLRRDAAGRWLPDERHLCHSPQERLFVGGQWQAGLLPLDGVGPATLAQYRRFAALVREAQHTASQQGQPFQVPFFKPKVAMALVHQSLAAIKFEHWLQTQSLDDPHLRAHLDYCCRDEYGAGLRTVSAWAGLHYFAARHGFVVPGDGGTDGSDPAGAGLFTWPEGNAWLTRRMAQPLGQRLYTGCAVLRIEAGRHGVQVDALHLPNGQVRRWVAQRCIVALPVHVAARVVAQPPAWLTLAASRVQHAPWVVTQLHLRQPLRDRGGAAPAWDNVFHQPLPTPQAGQPAPPAHTGLGYVDNTHQALHRTPGAPTVLTHYRALGDVPGARANLLAQPWQHWVQAAVADLLPAHPELPGLLTHASVARHAHAMAVPTPVFSSQIGLRRLSGMNSQLSPSSRLSFAHSDWGSTPVFEEAFALGHAAGGGGQG